MRLGLIQLTSSDDPAENARVTAAMVSEAAAQGAKLILTPEVTNCVSLDRQHQTKVLRNEADDATLRALSDVALRHGIWLSIGSLALKTDDADGRFANRSFLISPNGRIVARYDKIHMFDVAVSAEETYRESAGYRPGDQAVVADLDGTGFGMSICYDLRFPALYRALAQAGAQIIAVPAAFSPVTGAAHWEVLLRARAIETGTFIVAAAQTGSHPANGGRQRQTYGHSMVVSPWGEVLCDAGTAPGVSCCDIDLAEVSNTQKRLPSLFGDREFSIS